MSDNETATDYYCEKCGQTSSNRQMHCGKVMKEREVQVVDENTHVCPNCGATYRVGSKHNCSGA